MYSFVHSVYNIQMSWKEYSGIKITIIKTKYKTLEICKTRGSINLLKSWLQKSEQNIPVVKINTTKHTLTLFLFKPNEY
jgi:hypothetical protein